MSQKRLRLAIAKTPLLASLPFIKSTERSVNRDRLVFHNYDASALSLAGYDVSAFQHSDYPERLSIGDLISRQYDRRDVAGAYYYSRSLDDVVFTDRLV